ncbi:MAG: hypothetical protein D6794_12230 [Deltaproteobacteria bacterium]|nr:MAG: hypothetical protein D6794_12230 [Deltaproteobacteria bacterium]
MKRFLIALLLLSLLASACYRNGAAGKTSPVPPTATHSALHPPAKNTIAPPQATATSTRSAPPAFPPLPDAEYGQTDALRYVRIPMDANCANLTATPTVVGDWLVFPAHTRRECGADAGPHARELFGYNTTDGKLYSLYQGASGEAPLHYDAASGRLYWTVVFGGNLLILDAQTLQVRHKVGGGATSDSAGVVLDDLFYFGTVNGPDPACQQPINPDCGALFAVDASGNVVHKRNTDNGFRAWIGTSVTTDGTYLYWGSAAQTVGEKSGDESEYLYGCSVAKTDRDLNILASFDPGDPACFKLPFEGANEDSVSGEVVPDGNGLWVQYVRPNDAPDAAGAFQSFLYRLDNDLNEVCRLPFDFEPQTQSAGFYAAPTVDAAGRAYVPATVPDGSGGRFGVLLQVTPDCQPVMLEALPGVSAYASPTLADDRAVLFATDGRLQIIDLQAGTQQAYDLASRARVLSSPVIHDGVVYVLQEDGTLNIITDSGLSGYGQAIWPRYRHDNAASGRLDAFPAANPASGTVPASTPATAERPGPAAAFIAVHLEVPPTAGAVARRWASLENLVALADRYQVKLTLQFSWPWAKYVYENGLLDTVHAWEAEGHEIALHHHGPTHKFFDGYTNAPDAVRTDGWYATKFGYLGDMDALMAFMSPLSQRGITSAGMSDEESDWPAGVLYFATDSGDAPSKDDLLSRPVETTHNGFPVVEIYNAGFEIAHLGPAAVNLDDVKAALQSAAADEYLGLVLNDESFQQDFSLMEPLFQLLQDAGLPVETVSSLLEGQ